eukprot:XP_014027110.1 PREDICTED: folylpolyglutamate synthase, mitochondrial-like [Salmo salar]
MTLTWGPIATISLPGVPAFTVLPDRAEETGCPLWVCPDLEQYEVGADPLCLGLAGQQQRCNASLALQHSKTWLHCYQQSDQQNFNVLVENMLTRCLDNESS